MQRLSVVAKLMLIGLLALLVMPAVTPAHAVTSAIGAFYGGCNNFSVDVAVFGNNDDGNGLDKLRFKITDATNTVRYSEDASVRVGSTVGSQVVNLRYSSVATKNPIRFSVIDLDGSGKETGEVKFATYNATCLPGATNAPLFPFGGVNATIVAQTNIYDSPAGTNIGLVVRPGESHAAVYKNANGSWIAITIGGNELVWIPASTVQVSGALTVPPIRIFGSGYAAGQNEATGAVGSTGTGTGTFSGQTTVSATVRLRSLPGVSGQILAYIPANSTITLLGRNTLRTWVQVNYNGMVGWVASFYVRISSTNLRNLAVIQ